MTKWKPIETAPKGPEILVWDGKDIWLVNTEYNKMYPKENGCGCCSSSVHEEATHWMPLPKPPQLTIDVDDRRMRSEDLTGTIKRVKGD